MAQQDPHSFREGVASRRNALLSIVFSFRNEAEVLPELIRQTREVLSGEVQKGVLRGYELIFVNDASTDASLDILRAENVKLGDIRVINMSRVFGVSPCVLAGMKLARGDAVVYLDADLQDPPQVIPQLLEKWQGKEAPDVVHTVRLSRDGESRGKLLLTQAAYRLLHRITSIRLPIEAGDFKLLSRRVVDQLVRLREKRPFLRGLICWVGFKQETVHYRRRGRHAGETKFPVLSPKVIGNFLNSALISFSSFPLHLASFAGFLSILVSIGVLVYALHEKLSGNYVPGWTSLMVVVLFMGSIQLFCLGIHGLYLNSIFQETKGRPNYIIDSVEGFPPSASRSASSEATETPSSTQNRSGD